jgi:hypothetical protein
MGRMGSTHPNNPELLQAIGRMVVDTATLEFSLAYLLAMARDEDTVWLRKTLGSGKRVMKELQQVRNDLPPGELQAELARILRGAENLRDQRHSLVHAVPQWDDTSDGRGAEVVWWHPNSNEDLTVDAGRVNELAQTVRSLRRRVDALRPEIARWRETLGT